MTESPGRIAPASVTALCAGLAGRAIAPGDAEYELARQVHNASVDRHPGLIVRVANAADVCRTVGFAREGGTSADRAWRGPQPGRPRRRGRRDHGRSLRDARLRAGRPAPACVGRAGPHGRRVHPRRGGPRPGDPVRRHRVGRDRRDHAQRRDRLPGPQARPDDRPPGLRRAGHGGRQPARRERDVAPGPVLGGSRGRRQLRDRDPPPVRAAAGRPRARRCALPAGHARRAQGAGPHRGQRARGADHDRAPHARSAAPVHPGRRPRAADDRDPHGPRR
jgi:hypothetical protein